MSVTGLLPSPPPLCWHGGGHSSFTRIKKSLMTTHKKRGGGVSSISENAIRVYHPGSLYQIETLCNAITISLLTNGPVPTLRRFDLFSTFAASEKLSLAIPSNSDKNDLRRLSQLCTTLFRAFEDSVSPRFVPLFYDRNAGDV
jgi:hypothetical protein